MTDLADELHPDDDAQMRATGETAPSGADAGDQGHGREYAAGAHEAEVQASQDALFTADLPPAVRAEPDEGVTAFGGEANDLEAVREDLQHEDAGAIAPVEGGEPAAGEGGETTAEDAPQGRPEAPVGVAEPEPPATPEQPASAELLPAPGTEGLPETGVTAPAETPAAPAAEGTAEVVTPEAAAEAMTQGATAEVDAEAAATDEAAAAVVEAGVPEGADDDVDAVEALLDAEADAGMFEPERHTLSTPFLVYDAAWLVFAVTMVLVLRDAAVAGTLDAAPAYPVFVLIALMLTVLGPLLAVFLWWRERSRRSPDERRGLFASAFLRGALATFGGVAIWLVARVVLDYMRTGRLF